MSVFILEKTYKFNGQLYKRQQTKYIILHHEAGYGGGDAIHKSHQNNGWKGIGYHFIVRVDGTIERGRPENTVGSHCMGNNRESIGICFEGNYERDVMTKEQIEAGQRLLSYLYEKYNLSEKNVFKHKDKMATACPGRNFPFSKIVKGYDKTNANIVKNCKIYSEKNDWKEHFCSVSASERIQVIFDAGDGWSSVEYNNIKGYIKNSALQLDKGNPSKHQNKNITANVWLRSSRSLTKPNKIMKIAKGEKVKVCCYGEKWLKVKYKNEFGFIVKSKTNVK